MTPENYLAMIVSEIVTLPDCVRVERVVDDMGVLLTLHVDPTDMGLLIGRNGTTIGAIRTLVRITGIRNKQRISLKVDDPNPRNL